MSTNTPTFSSVIVNRLMMVFVIVFALMVGYLAVHWFTAFTTVDEISSEQIMVEREPVTTSAAYVLDQRKDECWTGSQRPKTTGLPGAAIILYNDDRAVYVNDPESVDAAFNEALASVGVEAPTTELFDVVALCK